MSVKRTCLTAFAVTAVVAVALRAIAADPSPPKFQSDAARRAKAKYDQEIERAEAAYRKSVREARTRLLSELEPAMAAATRRADLGEANRIAEFRQAIADQMNADPRKPGAPIPQGAIVGKQFHFMAVVPAISRLTLNADGTITGATHPNETSWRINGDAQLEFVHADGRTVTTRFDRLLRNGSDLYFEGEYLLEQGRRHGLSQVVE